MKRYALRIVYWVVIIQILFILPYQACAPLNSLDGSSEGKLDIPSIMPPSRPPPPPELIEGARLYSIHCASCHEPLERSTKRSRSFDQIKSAISSIAEMQEIASIRGLSNTEVQRIVDALTFSPPPPPPDLPPPPPPEEDGPAVVFQQPLGNRKFVAAKLKSLFSGGNATINTTIDSWTTNKVGIFGSPCNRTMPQCGGDESQNIIASGVASGSVLRSAYKIKTCEYVLEYDVAISNMLTQVGLTISSSRSRDNIRIVSEAITNGEVNDAVITDFQTIDGRLSGNSLESWRMILLTLCKSTLFENF